MKIGSPIAIAAANQMMEERSQELKKEKAATDFEEIFARHLVKEFTKDSFKMSDNGGVMGHSGNLYREFITDALAGELATQRKLGMADLVSRYWNSTPDATKSNS